MPPKNTQKETPPKKKMERDQFSLIKPYITIIIIIIMISFLLNLFQTVVPSG